MAFPVFDLHCDTADRLAWQTLPAELHAVLGSFSFVPSDTGGPEETVELSSSHGHISLEKIGTVPWAQCFACFIPDEFTPAEAVGFYRHVSDYMNDQVEKNRGRVAAVHHAGDIRPMLDAGSVAYVRTVENAKLFAADPDLVHKLADDGVLMASLSWNAPGPLASGHDAPERGITDAGRTVIAEMERHRIILDVSHLNDRCFDEVATLAQRPFVASHSNSRTVCGHRRNLTDAQFCEIRDRGGVVGLNYAGQFLREDARTTPPDFDDISRHIDHWLELGGENTIALGSDFDGCDTPADIATAANMPSFQKKMEARFGASITEKLAYGNALAFFERWAR